MSDLVFLSYTTVDGFNVETYVGETDELSERLEVTKYDALLEGDVTVLPEEEQEELFRTGKPREGTLEIFVDAEEEYIDDPYNDAYDDDIYEEELYYDEENGYNYDEEENE